jgi:hypothetical protein
MTKLPSRSHLGTPSRELPAHPWRSRSAQTITCDRLSRCAKQKRIMSSPPKRRVHPASRLCEDWRNRAPREQTAPSRQGQDLLQESDIIITCGQDICMNCSRCNYGERSVKTGVIRGKNGRVQVGGPGDQDWPAGRGAATAPWPGGLRALSPGDEESRASTVGSAWPACLASGRPKACCSAVLQLLRVEYPEGPIPIGD